MFQRTANFSLPARNGPMEAERERRHKAEYPARRAAAMDTPFASAAIPSRPSPPSTVAEAERDAAYEAKWQEGGSISYLYAYTDLLVNKAVERHRLGVRAQQDPQHREGPEDRRAAGAQGPSDRHQAALPRYQLLRDL